ncbi:N-lysine methyltransferase KMT5A-like [Nerophis ophidion]|uniref:N-lysine methyltransferase KMT5A-like n=1 Tax=Nerophis ophidion TaxID=159077 RepID=UPI002ADFC444|nr:N-lysine methyltransferase KMT5A-like [Nerophis ophidion]
MLLFLCVDLLGVPTHFVDIMSKRRARRNPEAEATEFILSGCDKSCLKAQWINDWKGRGVFACASIEKGSFVVEYRGELISRRERDKRQTTYTEKQNAFLFDFKWNDDIWCIDASDEDGSLGRLVNDAHKSPNCTMKKITVQSRPHLCLFAIENIQAFSEITYNYGQSQWPRRTQTLEVPSQDSPDSEMSIRQTSSLQQTPTVDVPFQHSPRTDVSDELTSSLKQTPTVDVPFQHSPRTDVSDEPTSSLKQM